MSVWIMMMRVRSSECALVAVVSLLFCGHRSPAVRVEIVAPCLVVLAFSIDALVPLCLLWFS